MNGMSLTMLMSYHKKGNCTVLDTETGWSNTCERPATNNSKSEFISNVRDIFVGGCLLD